MKKMKITVETVLHGFALKIDNKSWLLADERKLTEALAYQVSMASTSRVSKQRMQRVMNTIAYGVKTWMERMHETSTASRSGKHAARVCSRRLRRTGAALAD